MSNLYSADAIRSANFANAKRMVRENLAVNDTWLIRGLLAIYARQTADEKSSEHTKHDNEVGFNGLDAPILSSFAKQVIQWNNTEPRFRRFNSPLSPKQLVIARRKMAKYSGQLTRIARQPQVVVA